MAFWCRRPPTLRPCLWRLSEERLSIAPILRIRVCEPCRCPRHFRGWNASAEATISCSPPTPVKPHGCCCQMARISARHLPNQPSHADLEGRRRRRTRFEGDEEEDTHEPTIFLLHRSDCGRPVLRAEH